MNRLSILEYGKIARADLPARVLDRLERFDLLHARTSGESVFDWSGRHQIRAKNWVGVVQVPGLSVEILPKVDHERAPELRRLLLYMLAVAGAIPIRERDIASLETERFSLLEALVAIFAQQLLVELQRGVPRAYVWNEADSPVLRGRLLLAQQLSRNAGRLGLLHVGYDEFSDDTLLNQIFKYGCEVLLGRTNRPETQRCLREALLYFDAVDERVIQDVDFEKVHLNRNSERFRPFLDFCRLVVRGFTPSISTGRSPTFSLLFPMERVFEQFVGRLLRGRAVDLGLARDRVHLQARGKRHWLLKQPNGRGRFRLKPDVLVTGASGKPALILDTKWKVLAADASDPKGGVSQPDLYQLYAYATRYRCPDNVLLFPQSGTTRPVDYQTFGDDSRRLRIALIDLSLDLPRQQEELVAQLRDVLWQEPELAAAQANQ